jgi:hypothetical protein
MGERRRALVATMALLCAMALGARGAFGSTVKPRTSPAAKFGPPTLVTPPGGFGYEPTVLVDRFNNIFATAHKENWQLVIAPDTNSPTYTRAMSWMWVSTDGGASFGNLPGLTPLSLEHFEFGDEGDIALDDAGHLYFVDTNVVDDTITRWSVTGHGTDHITLDFTRPIIPTIQPVDDRPWVTAHGNGSVFYLGNEGDKSFGGRYLLYQSYDGGQTFAAMPTVLEDSGWCRPAADHRRGSKYVYVTCTNDEGLLYAYVSSDDGHTFSRSTIGKYNNSLAWQSWPTPVVAPDGTVLFTFVDARKVDADGAPTENILWLYSSRNQGKSWTRQDITPRSMVKGQMQYAWLAVSPRDAKRLGVGLYFRPNTSADWRVYGAIWKAGEIPTLVSLDPQHPATSSADPQAPGDYLASSFGPDGRLSVVWTQIAKRFVPYGFLGLPTIGMRYIYFVRSL